MARGAEAGKDFQGELFGACNLAGHAVILEAYVKYATNVAILASLHESGMIRCVWNPEP